MNRTTLFAYLRRAPFGGRLTTAQVRGVETILAACEAFAVTDLRWIAYMGSEQDLRKIDAILASGKWEPSTPSILRKSCSDPFIVSIPCKALPGNARKGDALAK